MSTEIYTPASCHSRRVMYTISNKFARFKQSCRCAICQAGARASGRVGSSRRAATYSTASLRQLFSNPYVTTTTFYTTMVAFAMSVDGHVKKKRSRNWENVIAYERSTIGQLSAEESRIKKKLAGKVAFEDDLHDINENEVIDSGVEGQRVTKIVNRRFLTKSSRARKAQYSTLAKRASSPDQIDESFVESEKGSELDVHDLPDWQKAYQASPYDHGQAMELDAPVLGPEQQTENMDPQSIYAPLRLRQFLYENRWTPKKLRTAEIITARLVVKLLRYHKSIEETDGSGDKGETAGKEPRTTEDFLDEAPLPNKIDYLASLSRADLQEVNRFLFEKKEALAHMDPFDEEDDGSLPAFIPSFCQDSAGMYHKHIREVNRTIRSTFQKHSAGKYDLQTAIHKICNELLTSTSAPNLHTYNMLLVELSSLANGPAVSLFPFGNGADNPISVPKALPEAGRRTQFRRIAPMVDLVFAALRDANIRPNEITCALMLNHYIERNDANAFARFVALMRGQKKGLMLAHPNVSFDPEGPVTTRLKSKAERPEKLIQAVTPTPTVAEALINGVLHFLGLEEALEVLGSLADDGWGIDERGLASIVRHCARQKRWNEGSDCWDRLRELVMTSRTSTSSTPHPRCAAYRAYIALCCRCNKRDALRTAVDEAIQIFNCSARDMLVGLSPREIKRACSWLCNNSLNEKMWRRENTDEMSDAQAITASPDLGDSSLDRLDQILQHDGKQRQEQEQKVNITEREPVIMETGSSSSIINTPLPVFNDDKVSTLNPESTLTSKDTSNSTFASEPSVATKPSPLLEKYRQTKQLDQKQGQPPIGSLVHPSSQDTNLVTPAINENNHSNLSDIPTTIPQSAQISSLSKPPSVQKDPASRTPSSSRPTLPKLPSSPIPLPSSSPSLSLPSFQSSLPSSPLRLPPLASPSRPFPTLTVSMNPNANLNPSISNDDISAHDIPLVDVSS